MENQHFADERIPLLLQTPAAVRFISAEPLLGPVDLSSAAILASAGCFERGLDWVIVGGESGHGARPFDLAWARSIVQQCQAASVPVFIKQLGAKPRATAEQVSRWPDYVQFRHAERAGCGLPHIHNIVLRDRKGSNPAEWSEDLRVREWPDEART